MARFVWETREAFRRPGEAPQGRALKTREDEKKRKSWGARGEALRKGKGALGAPGGLMADRKHGGGLGGGKGVARETPTEMRRHAKPCLGESDTVYNIIP